MSQTPVDAAHSVEREEPNSLKSEKQKLMGELDKLWLACAVVSPNQCKQNNSGIDRCDAACQTNEYSNLTAAWSKYSTQLQEEQQLQQPPISADDQTPLNAESIRQIAEQSLQSQGFVYRAHTPFYYDISNDLYYDQREQLYYEVETGVYYKYALNRHTNVYHLRYHSRLKRTEREQMRRVIGAAPGHNELPLSHANDSAATNLSGSGGGGGVDADVDDDGDDNDDDADDDEYKTDAEQQQELAQRCPPCIRAIRIQPVQAVDSQAVAVETATATATATSSDHTRSKLGKLFIVPYTAGAIGNSMSESSHDQAVAAQSSVTGMTPYAIDLRDDEPDVERVHAKLEYDLSSKCYTIEDAHSVSGTFVNAQRLEAGKVYKLKHGDKLQVGACFCLLVHIHAGLDTCIYCEPGEVLRSLDQQQRKQQMDAVVSPSAADRKLDTKSKEVARRVKALQIKKKYGLDKANATTGASSRASYNDRAEQRRQEVGVDFSHIEESRAKAASASAADASTAELATIGARNVGYQLLSKMGWKQGEGVGKTNQGIREPIVAKVKASRGCIGADANESYSICDDTAQKKKVITWTKTAARFHKLDATSSSANVPCVFKESDDEA